MNTERRNSYTLSVGTQNQNDSMEAHLRSENRTTMGVSHPTSRSMSKGNEIYKPQTYLSVHVY
ncbi:hypothetical protein I79_006366 [Cricetulus griseus]|uniref:Uncharacterized protein n=1 Tax=Cricetulus griseus TaxID=10029 RepID=G3H7N1_CRIGR|nr:hypothetical protein I79_006366 [Cricetulus griseus]